MHQIGNTRSNKREDYAYLSDAEFANFRAVETTGMGMNTLYRSSSPINPSLERNDEADNALRDAGIRIVMNMADSDQSMTRFADFGLTAYSQCDIITLDMTMNYDSDDFRKDLAKAFGIKSIYDDGVDLSSCAEVFLKDIGMSDDEISSLRENLIHTMTP